MFEIKVTVSCPDLVLAATALSKAMIGRSTENEQPANHTPAASAVCPASAVQMTAPAAVATPAAVVAPVAPVAPENPIPAAPMASPAPVAVPVQTPPQTAAAPVTAASTVLVTTAPQITIEQIGKAGADLITAKPESQAQLLALLQKYGVQSAHQLKPEQIGPFATEMRALGARI